VLAFGIIIGCADPAVSWDGDLVGSWTEDRGDIPAAQKNKALNTVSFHNGGRFEVKLDNVVEEMRLFLELWDKVKPAVRTAWESNKETPNFDPVYAIDTTEASLIGGLIGAFVRTKYLLYHNTLTFYSIEGYRGTYTVAQTDNINLYTNDFENRTSNGGRLQFTITEVLVRVYQDYDDNKPLAYVTNNPRQNFQNAIEADMDYKIWVPFAGTTAANIETFSTTLYNSIEAHLKNKYPDWTARVNILNAEYKLLNPTATKDGYTLVKEGVITGIGNRFAAEAGEVSAADNGIFPDLVKGDGKVFDGSVTIDPDTKGVPTGLTAGSSDGDAVVTMIMAGGPTFGLDGQINGFLDTDPAKRAAASAAYNFYKAYTDFQVEDPDVDTGYPAFNGLRSYTGTSSLGYHIRVAQYGDTEAQIKDIGKLFVSMPGTVGKFKK